MYLLFSPNDVLPLDQVVINTEAHPLPRFDMGPLFWTGWQRKPRGVKSETGGEKGENEEKKEEKKAEE